MGKNRVDLSADINIGQLVSRRIAEAFKYGIDCDIIHGGLLEGKSEQGIHEANAVQNYVLGTRRITPDGRVFRYGKCGENLVSTKTGVFNGNILVTQVAAIVSAVAKGATSLTVTFNSEDFWDIALAADELYGGYISIYNSDATRDQRMIISNTAVGASGGACTIGIDAPLSAAITSTVNCEVLANPYAKLQPSGEGYMSVMGMPAVIATADDYFWIQTWGPLRITPIGAKFTASAPDSRMAVFASNGGIRRYEAVENTAGNIGEQWAGFIIENTQGVGGAPFIMLQISP